MAIAVGSTAMPVPEYRDHLGSQSVIGLAIAGFALVLSNLVMLTAVCDSETGLRLNKEARLYKFIVPNGTKIGDVGRGRR
jgi:hypothetical protein